MRIQKGTLVEVWHERSGHWIGKATKTFDTNKEEFYPLVLAQDDPVQGMSNTWYKGEPMAARNTLCKIKILKA